LYVQWLLSTPRFSLSVEFETVTDPLYAHDELDSSRNTCYFHHLSTFHGI
jgi:hypothetical protein